MALGKDECNNDLGETIECSSPDWTSEHVNQYRLRYDNGARNPVRMGFKYFLNDEGVLKYITRNTYNFIIQVDGGIQERTLTGDEFDLISSVCTGAKSINPLKSRKEFRELFLL